MSYAVIRPKRGTFHEWSTVNPVLYQGEIVVEHPDSGAGTGLCKFKIGDGTHKYLQLPYAFDGASASSIVGGNVDTYNNIQLRSDTTDNWKVKNPVLLAGEIVYDTTAQKIKIGDGSSHWADLKYIGGEESLIDDYGDEDADDTDTASLEDLV